MIIIIKNKYPGILMSKNINQYQITVINIIEFHHMCTLHIVQYNEHIFIYTILYNSLIITGYTNFILSGSPCTSILHEYFFSWVA